MLNKIQITTELPKLDHYEHTDENWGDTEKASTHNTVHSYIENWYSLQIPIMDCCLWQDSSVTIFPTHYPKIFRILH